MECGMRNAECGILNSAHRTPHTAHGTFSIEYAALMAIVAAMLMGMSVYSMRALCGRWRQVGDTFGYGRQYEPGVTVRR